MTRTIKLYNEFHLGDQIFNFILFYNIKTYLEKNEIFIDYYCNGSYHNQIHEFNCSETSDGFKESFLESIQDPFSYESIINSAETNYYILPVLEKLKKHNTLYQALDYFIQGHSYEEIAGLMGIAVGTVKSRLFEARKFVKENISEEFLANV